MSRMATSRGFPPRGHGPWLAEADVPVIVSGMITSRNGWVETPYVDLPAGPAELADKLTRHPLSAGPDRALHHRATALDATGAPDVMRGEETEIAGLLGQGFDDGLIVMPGTHAKWVRIEAGRIADFETFMTGEVFAALKDATILGTLMEDGPFNEVGFALGSPQGWPRAQIFCTACFTSAPCRCSERLPGKWPPTTSRAC